PATDDQGRTGPAFLALPASAVLGRAWHLRIMLPAVATIVAFHAHPDDEVLLTGGTIAALAAQGHRVIIVVALAGAPYRHGDRVVRRARGTDGRPRLTEALPFAAVGGDGDELSVRAEHVVLAEAL